MTEVSREERRGGGEIGFWAGRQRGGRVWSLAAINLEQRIGLASGEERPAFCLLRSSAERKGGATTPSSLLPLSPQLHLPPPSPSPSHQFAYRNPCRLRPKPHPDLVREMFQPEKGSEVSPLVESPSPAMEGKLGSRHSLLIGEFSSVATFKHFQGTALADLGHFRLPHGGDVTAYRYENCGKTESSIMHILHQFTTAADFFSDDDWRAYLEVMNIWMVQTERIQHYNYKGLPGVTAPKGSLEESIKPDPEDLESSALYNILYPSKELLPDDKEMSIFDHLEELRQRIFISALAVGAAILGCFAFSKQLIFLLEAPVSTQGVRFLQLSPGEFFFTTIKVSGYCGLLIGSPIILYEIIAFVLPGLTKDERRFLGPIVLGSSVLFYAGIAFSYIVLAPAALTFFVNYAEGAVESIWSIDQYFEFILILMFSTGLSFQVPVIQLLLGQVGLVSSDQMLSIWRYVVVGAVVAAAVLTPSTDPLTQMLLAGPLLGLYLGGAYMVKLTGR
ncbi:sec-independent protein translocase protein TATC [Carex littledalei]|uniref:Sec-independent protein translocase protein TATC n=1 Tax=Carex littledalei TaxID=544730 RepID=A0A833W140_9POAL|nr:sec-independent protein translocase protein TATC [Carex littledalei]